MPMFQAIVTEMASTRRWYFVKAKNLNEAQAKLNVGDTFEEQDILGSTEVLHRFVESDTVERAPFREKKKP
ncbi:MAG: hypothetical protein K8T91_08645 [Planctomycetes bacterium]|nr:hypothetical protein [Planctomycetota bacterium]